VKNVRKNGKTAANTIDLATVTVKTRNVS